MSLKAICSSRNEKQFFLSQELLQSKNQVYLVDLSEKFSILHTQTLLSNSVCDLKKYQGSHVKDCHFKQMFLYVQKLNLMSTNNQRMSSISGIGHECTQTNVTCSILDTEK